MSHAASGAGLGALRMNAAGLKPAKNEGARDRSLWRLNRVNSQVTRTMHRPVQPCDQAASFLASRIFRLCRRWVFEFPRIRHPSAVPASKSPGCPDSSLHQQRLSMHLQVSPNPASSGCADGEFPGLPESSPSAAPANGSPGFPGSRILRQRRLCVFERPRILHLRLGR